MSRHRTYRFKLNLLKQEYLSYYAGTARWVVARAFEGENIRFPASFLREFVNDDGVQGFFEMVVDEDDKLVSLQRITPPG